MRPNAPGGNGRCRPWWKAPIPPAAPGGPGARDFTCGSGLGLFETHRNIDARAPNDRANQISTALHFQPKRRWDMGGLVEAQGRACSRAVAHVAPYHRSDLVQYNSGLVNFVPRGDPTLVHRFGVSARKSCTQSHGENGGIAGLRRWTCDAATFRRRAAPWPPCQAGQPF